MAALWGSKKKRKQSQSSQEFIKIQQPSQRGSVFERISRLADNKSPIYWRPAVQGALYLESDSNQARQILFSFNRRNKNWGPKRRTTLAQSPARSGKRRLAPGSALPKSQWPHFSSCCLRLSGFWSQLASLSDPQGQRRETQSEGRCVTRWTWWWWIDCCQLRGRPLRTLCRAHNVALVLANHFPSETWRCRSSTVQWLPVQSQEPQDCWAQVPALLLYDRGSV